jgi:hypothetical protein
MNHRQSTHHLASDKPVELHWWDLLKEWHILNRKAAGANTNNDGMLLILNIKDILQLVRPSDRRIIWN